MFYLDFFPLLFPNSCGVLLPWQYDRKLPRSGALPVSTELRLCNVHFCDYMFTESLSTNMQTVFSFQTWPASDIIAFRSWPSIPGRQTQGNLLKRATLLLRHLCNHLLFLSSYSFCSNNCPWCLMLRSRGTGGWARLSCPGRTSRLISIRWTPMQSMAQETSELMRLCTPFPRRR